MKTSELIGPALDWAVAKCEGHGVQINHVGCIHRLYFDFPPNYPYAPIHYSTDWSQGGPIIERELDKGMNLYGDGSRFGALYYDIDTKDTEFSYFGPTPLIAAMRCFVASKFGDEIEIPEQLKD